MMTGQKKKEVFSFFSVDSHELIVIPLFQSIDFIGFLIGGPEIK